MAQAEPTAGKLWFDLRLQDAADSTTAVVAWPAAEDVIAEPENDPARALVLAVLASSQSTSPESTAPQLGRGGEEFVENLKTALAAKGFTFTDGFLISELAPAPKVRLGLEYTSFSSSAPAPVLPETFELWVRTRLLPADSPAFRWSISALAENPAVQAMLRTQRGETAVGAPAPTIPAIFSLVILPTEGPWLRPLSTQPPPADQFTPIFAVAVATAEEATRQQMLQKPRTPPNRDELAAALRACFGGWSMTGEISLQDELSAVDNAYGRSDQPAWVLRLTAFDPVERATVSIDDIQLGTTGRQPWAAFVAHQQAAGKTIERLIAQKNAREKELTTWLAAEFPWGQPHFATAADHERRVTAISLQPGVAAVETKVFRDQVAYSVVWYPVLTTWEGAGTYSSDRGGNVSSKLTVQARDFGASAEGFIANHRSGIFADFSTTPKLTQLPDQAMVTWGGLGEYTRESPVHLGTPKVFSLQEEQSRAGVRWRLEGGHSTTKSSASTTSAVDPAVASITRTRRWKIDVIAGYRRARLTADNFAFVETPDGEAPFASTEFTGEWEHGATGASPLSALKIELSADASIAHRDTPRFARGQFKAAEEIRFGRNRWENSLMRMTVSGGAATEDTPVAWWFRLGGDERMRGFELGELAGRSFVHADIEAGVTLGAFLKRPAVPTSGQPAPGFNFRQIRLLLGVEHAWIGDVPMLVPPIPATRASFSYSVTGEYAGGIPGLPGNSKLAIGYGYAPDSFHRSGRVFVTLRIPLSLPQPP